MFLKQGAGEEWCEWEHVNMYALRDLLCNWSCKGNQTTFMSLFQWLEVESPFFLSKFFSVLRNAGSSLNVCVWKAAYIEICVQWLLFMTYNYLVKGVWSFLKTTKSLWSSISLSCTLCCRQLWADMDWFYFPDYFLPMDKMQCKISDIWGGGGGWRLFFISSFFFF